MLEASEYHPYVSQRLKGQSYQKKLSKVFYEMHIPSARGTMIIHRMIQLGTQYYYYKEDDLSKHSFVKL